MTLEDLEYELRGRIIEKNWEVDDVFPADDFFLLQLRGFYKRKELKYTDLLELDTYTFLEFFLFDVVFLKKDYLVSFHLE